MLPYLYQIFGFAIEVWICAVGEDEEASNALSLSDILVESGSFVVIDWMHRLRRNFKKRLTVSNVMNY